MNGDPATRKSIVTRDIKWPNGLSLDSTLNRLWWADAGVDRIESANLDGSQRRVVLSGGISHPFAITVFEDFMYWTDWRDRAIYKADKFSGSGKVAVSQRHYFPMDIQFYHQMRQPKGKASSIAITVMTITVSPEHKHQWDSEVIKMTKMYML